MYESIEVFVKGVEKLCVEAKEWEMRDLCEAVFDKIYMI